MGKDIRSRNTRNWRKNLRVATTPNSVSFSEELYQRGWGGARKEGKVTCRCNAVEYRRGMYCFKQIEYTCVNKIRLEYMKSGESKSDANRRGRRMLDGGREDGKRGTGCGCKVVLGPLLTPTRHTSDFANIYPAIKKFKINSNKIIDQNCLK